MMEINSQTKAIIISINMIILFLLGILECVAIALVGLTFIITLSSLECVSLQMDWCIGLSILNVQSGKERC